MTIQPIGSDPYTISSDQTVRAAETAAYVKAAGFSGNDLVTALAIARAESGWDYKAKGGPNTNGTYDWGLFQINDVHKPTDAEKTRPLENAKRAHQIYAAAGNTWSPWSTYHSGAYKQYLPAGKAAVAELQKRGPSFEADTLKKDGDGSVIAPGKLETLGPSNPLDSIGKLLQDVTNKSLRFFNVSLGVVLGIALLALGVVLLGRGIASRVVAGTLKDVAKNASKTAPAVKPTLTVEQRAAKSLDYSEARKKLQNQRSIEAADRAREALRVRMRQG